MALKGEVGESMHDTWGCMGLKAENISGVSIFMTTLNRRY